MLLLKQDILSQIAASQGVPSQIRFYFPDVNGYAALLQWILCIVSSGHKP